MPSRCRPLLGTFVEVTADDESAIEAAFDAIGRVHRLMSAHDPDSDVSRIGRFAHRGAVTLDLWTALVLERALFWSRQSEGAFDVVRAGAAAVESGYLPRHRDQPQPEVQHWTWLQLQGRSVRLHKPGSIDLGGIAKGFAVDRAVEALRRAGVRAGLVNAGGDLAGFGPVPWPVEIVDPRCRAPLLQVELRDRALATSAMIDGEFRHLPDRNPQWISVIVRAPQAIDADALTKIVISGSPLAGDCLELVGANALRISADGAVRSVEREEAVA